MKKTITLLFCVILFLLIGCSHEKKEAEIVDTINTEIKTYYEMSDGTWQMDGISYLYRLEISGTMPNAVKDSTFVYLSNLEGITFEQAWKAAGLSSQSTDYFAIEDAVLVEWRTQ